MSPSPHADFALLYGAVSRQMAAFGDAQRREGAITTAEATWFADLLVRFEIEFGKWGDPSGNPGVNAYLAALERQPRLLRLAGQVFLHIGFDLPRVIRASFGAHPRVDVHRMRAIFLQPASVLHVSTMRRTELRGYASLVSLITHRAALETLAHWVQTLRSTAWIHAEIARDANVDTDRLEANLIGALQDALATLRTRPALGEEGSTARDRAPAVALLRHLLLRRDRTDTRRKAATLDGFGWELHRRLPQAVMRAAGEANLVMQAAS